ncbi:hypothetical protein FSC37_22355 [Piscinibacter aquaticus]|uniref:Uncharacterized protein n=1 Tax=Piscinibacter aquaticus TaxID=392597 RepID=A0A5C6TR16_9BURK|nr:hypothetical protein FSC37_22355 [Piscinibacter aquaticus]
MNGFMRIKEVRPLAALAIAVFGASAVHAAQVKSDAITLTVPVTAAPTCTVTNNGGNVVAAPAAEPTTSYSAWKAAGSGIAVPGETVVNAWYFSSMIQTAKISCQNYANVPIYGFAVRHGAGAALVDGFPGIRFLSTPTT